MSAPYPPAGDVRNVAADLHRLADRPDLPADAVATLSEAAQVLHRVADRITDDDQRAGRHARIVALVRYAADGQEPDLLRLLTSEQVRR